MYVFKPDNTATHHEMNIAGNTFTPVIYKSHDNYAEKTQVWQSTKSSHKVYTYCRSCGTGQGKYNTTPWSRVKCRECGVSFEYLMGAEVNV